MAKRRNPLAAALQVTPLELDRLLGNDEPAPPPDGHVVPSWLSFYASLEQGAGRLATYEPISLPGLFQTPAYTEAVIRTDMLSFTDEQVAQMVAARMARQSVLDREPVPLEVRCVIDESVLHRVTGSPHTMGEQLDRLVVEAQRPSIQLQVLPAGSTVAHTAWFGPFFLFTAEGGTQPYMYCDENLGGFHYNDNPQVIDVHRRLFDHLCEHALPPDQSADLIQHLAETYR